MRRNKIAAGFVVVAVGVGGIVSASSSARPAATYNLSASGTSLKFNKSTVNASSGRVTLRLTNQSSIPHNVGIKGRGTGKTVMRNGVSTYSATLRKGTYTFYCGVGQHERAGMKGKLVVR